jgi:hypothetical protein
MGADAALQCLAESLNSAPHPATPSMLRSSTTCALFMNPVTSASTDFVCLEKLTLPVEGASGRGNRLLSKDGASGIIGAEDVALSLRLIAK